MSGSIFSFGGNQADKEDTIKKTMLLKFCDLDELVKIWNAYVSKDKPKFQYEDGNGLKKFREPTRIELTDALIKQVPLQGIIKVHKHLKENLDRIEEGSEQ